MLTTADPKSGPATEKEHGGKEPTPKEKAVGGRAEKDTAHKDQA